MQIVASFSINFYFYPSQPFQMGPEKIRETTNQLSLALDHAIPQQNIVTSFYNHLSWTATMVGHDLDNGGSWPHINFFIDLCRS